MSEIAKIEEERRFEHSVSAVIIEIEALEELVDDASALKDRQIDSSRFILSEADDDSELDSLVKNQVAGYSSILRNSGLIKQGIEELKSSEERPRYLRFYSSTDEKTGRRITLFEFNRDFDVFSGTSYAGARKSRSAEDFVNIFTQVVGQDAGSRLANIFNNYGHASVADMSPVMLYIDGLSMNDAFRIFNYSSVGGGQELSTRYVEFGEQSLHDLAELGVEQGPYQQIVERRFANLAALQTANYNKWLNRLKPALRDFLMPQKGQHNERQVNGSVETRSLDVARYWLPMGSKTGMCYMTSVRNWVDIARQLNQNGLPDSQDLANHIVDVLKMSETPEAKDLKANLGSLTKYYEGTDTIRNNQLELQQQVGRIALLRDIQPEQTERVKGSLSQVDKMAQHQDKYESTAFLTQQLAVIMPNVHPNTIRQAINSLGEDEVASLGEIIFSGHTQHDQMARAGDVRGTPYVVDTALGLQRDLNRHRSFGRLQMTLDSLNTLDTLKLGFNQSYAMHNAEYWQEFESEWLQDFEEFYEQLFELLDGLEVNGTDPEVSARVLREILPLGHQVRAIYSGPPTQMSYMTSLRVAVGGDFGYRDVVWQMLELAREDPAYRHMSSHLEKPDINSPEQLLGRS